MVPAAVRFESHRPGWHVVGPRGLTAFALLAVLLSAPGTAPSGSLPGSLGGQTLPPPFLFQPRSQPKGGYQDQLRAWLQAAGQHGPGDPDEGARAVALLSPDELSDVIAGFTRGAARLPRGSTKGDFVKRAAILHTDIAMLAVAHFEGAADFVNVSERASLHLGAAMELVNALGRESPHDPFVLAWWRAIAAVLSEQQEFVSAPGYMQRAVSLFPGDPEILLMAGVSHELLASPVVQDYVSDQGMGDLYGREGSNLESAERCYRAALRAEPASIEASIRLGHTLGQRGRHEAAVAQLNRVADGEAPRELRYFKHLFVGEAQEALGRHEAARDAYARALDLYPGAQSAHLALARLERRAGDRARTVLTVRRLLDRPANEEAREDPWRLYFVAESARRADSMLDALRAPFRRQP